MRGLQVEVRARSSLSLLLGGECRGVTVRASAARFAGGVSVSAGLRCETEDELRVAPPRSFGALPRLAAPVRFSVVAALTERDLNASSPLRDTLEQLVQQLVRHSASALMNRFLPQAVGGIAVRLRSIQVNADDDKLYLRGSLRFGGNGGGDDDDESAADRLLFTVRCGVGVGPHDASLPSNRIYFTEPELISTLFGREVRLPFLTRDGVAVEIGDDMRIDNVIVQNGIIVVKGTGLIRTGEHGNGGADEPRLTPARRQLRQY